MVKKVQESKEKKAAKIASASNKEKKKWTQGKTREAVRRSVTVDADMFSKIERDAAKATLVTAPAVAEKFGLNVGVAQKVLEHLCAGGVLRCLSHSSRPRLYSRVQRASAKPADAAPPAAEASAQNE